MNAVLRVLVILFFGFIITLGGHGGGFVWQLLVQLGPRGVLVQFWFLSIAGLVGVLLSFIPLGRVWAAWSLRIGVVSLLVATIELCRTSEAWVVTVVTALPFVSCSVILLRRDWHARNG